jgi:putative NIF3 family GTP cyclohydrolase 1 type 2
MRLADVIALVEGWYPPHRAEDWDTVGLVCGDPDAEVRRILLAVDPVSEVAAEAVKLDADLLIVHHPLYLKGTTSVAASTSKGKVVHDLIRANCGLLTAHTNADSPACGVSEAIAQALGLSEIRPLDPDFEESLDKIVVSVPIADAEALRAALAAAGAGAIGDYDAASFTTAQGRGQVPAASGCEPDRRLDRRARSRWRGPGRGDCAAPTAWPDHCGVGRRAPVPGVGLRGDRAG